VPAELYVPVFRSSGAKIISFDTQETKIKKNVSCVSFVSRDKKHPIHVICLSLLIFAELSGANS
jgi:hypothetical protein